MYKISVFLILLTMGLILKKVDAMVEKQITASEPVVVQAQHNQEQHKEAAPLKGRRKNLLTPEKFKEKVMAKVNGLKAFKNSLIPLRDQVDEGEKSWFDLFVRCADKWIEALESYQSPDTNIHRSDRLANKELKAAMDLRALKPTHRHAQSVYPQKDIDRLEARFNEVKVHADKLEGDNRKAFEAMIYCAGEYLMALKAAKGQPLSVRRVLSRAMTYVNTAETFLHNRAHGLHAQ